MHFSEIIDVVIDVLRSRDGRFVTAYQICKQICRENPELWDRLTLEYPSLPGRPEMGEDAGTPYSPASFVAHALRYHNQKHPGLLLTGKFDSTDAVFEGVEPGFRGGWLSIWSMPVD